VRISSLPTMRTSTDGTNVMTSSSATSFARNRANGSAFRRSPADANGAPYEIVYGPDTLRWQEQNMLDLHGRLCGPGLHWYLPQTDTGI